MSRFFCVLNQDISLMDFEYITFDQSALACSIAEQANKTVHYARVIQFSDGETHVTFDNPDFWRNKQVVIIQTTYPLPHQHILHVAFLAHELKNVGAATVTALIPYFAYSRQEISCVSGTFGHAYVVAQLLQQMIDRIITIEAHGPLLQNFFTIPFHSLSLVDLIARHIKQHIDLSQGVAVVAVDEGAYNRAQAIADRVNCNVIRCTKERFGCNNTKMLSMSGQMMPTVILVDDIIDTGNTALDVCAQLKENGAERIIGYFVHPVLSAHAAQKLDTMFDRVFVSNTIALQSPHDTIDMIDISAYIVEQLKQIK
jgi:ribose-phosphate pyrophosphokinase